VALGGGAFDSDESFESRWDKTLDINISALAIFIRACVPALLKSDAARIVNIASTEHFVTGPANAAYSATKSAVTGLTRSFAVELGKYGNITVRRESSGAFCKANRKAGQHYLSGSCNCEHHRTDRTAECCN
jgi:3-oxoacyl-[acyl-carrier protein] reductase